MRKPPPLKASVSALARPGFLNRSAVSLILIALLGILAYSNTFHAPFQWDERTLIVENPIIKDLNYFCEPSEAKRYPEYGIFKRRYVSFLTFALNYKIHGLDVTGYHMFNLLIHILNALLVYAFVMLTLRTPYLGSSPLQRHSRLFALSMSLLFVTHPVQTEAVTYVMQRFASLVAFFYLLSITLYIKWRLSTVVEGKKTAGLKFYLLCLVSAALAMKTKETSLTLPLAVLLYELLFFRGPVKTRTLPVIPLFLLLIIFPLSLTETGLPVGKVLFGVGPEAGEHISGSTFDRDYLQPSYSRSEYLITQFRVIVTYLRLLFFPVNQNLLYDYPLYKSLFAPQALLSFLFLIFVAGLAVYSYHLSRSKHPGLRLIAFGILWFFLTLSVESSILPIPLIIAEYRLYLPSVGIFLSALSGLILLTERMNPQKTKTVLVTLLVLLPLVFSAATYARNSLWTSMITLWEDVTAKSPWKTKGHYNLALAYTSRGLINQAIEHYQAAVRIKPDYAKAHNNLGIAFKAKGLTDRAIEHYRIALRLRPDYPEAHNNLGNVYDARGLTGRAIEHYRSAIRLKPHYAEAHYNLALAYASEGLIDKAIEHYETALRLRPDYPEAHNNLGNAYDTKGLTGRAIEQYKSALRLRPDYPEAHYNLGVVYLKEGLLYKAEEHFRMAKSLKRPE